MAPPGPLSHCMQSPLQPARTTTSLLHLSQNTIRQLNMSCCFSPSGMAAMNSTCDDNGERGVYRTCCSSPCRHSITPWLSTMPAQHATTWPQLNPGRMSCSVKWLADMQHIRFLGQRHLNGSLCLPFMPARMNTSRVQGSTCARGQHSTTRLECRLQLLHVCFRQKCAVSHSILVSPPLQLLQALQLPRFTVHCPLRTWYIEHWYAEGAK